MSETMEQAVLRMPPNLWSNDRIDVVQRHARYVQAANDLVALRDMSEKLAIMLEGIVTATENWNKSVTKIVGRQPKTGIGTEEARALLAEFEKYKQTNTWR